MRPIVRLAGFMALAAAFLLAGCENASDQDTEVQAATSCPDSRCVSTSAAVDAIGWTFLEPSILPSDFELYSRTVERDPPQPGAPQEGRFTVFLDFRFRGSPNVPGVIVTQTRPLDGAEISVRPRLPECGELSQSSAGAYYYVKGLISVLTGPQADLFLVCRDEASPHAETHSVVMARDGILIEVLAFPEAGVDREELLLLLESLRPADD